MSDCQIKYKLHPSEYNIWKEYPDLCRLAEVANVEILDSDVDLYSLFATSFYQIGVFSTAIYEGIGMGCKTVLLNLPGVEYMDDLVASSLAVLLTPGEKLSTTLERAARIPVLESASELFGDQKSVLGAIS